MLILPPAGGDELQGIKKGIVELADLIVVNKADGDLRRRGRPRRRPITARAIHLLRPAIARVDAADAEGLGSRTARAWTRSGRRSSAFRGDAGRARTQGPPGGQAKAWMWSEIEEGLLGLLRHNPGVAGRLPGPGKEGPAGADDRRRRRPDGPGRVPRRRMTGGPRRQA